MELLELLVELLRLRPQLSRLEDRSPRLRPCVLGREEDGVQPFEFGRWVVTIPAHALKSIRSRGIIHRLID